MKRFRSEKLALMVKDLTWRITGDHATVQPRYSQKGNLSWQVIRTDAAGKKYLV